MSEIFKIKPLLSEPSTDLHILLVERTIFVIALFGVIAALIKLYELWNVDNKRSTSDIITYLIFFVFVAFVAIDSVKAFTVSSKPSPTLFDIADKISVEGNQVMIAPIKDKYLTYQYNGRLKVTDTISLTLEEYKEDEEKFKLIDWKSDEYSITKEEYEMLKSKRHS